MNFTVVLEKHEVLGAGETKWNSYTHTVLGTKECKFTCLFRKHFGQSFDFKWNEISLPFPKCRKTYNNYCTCLFQSLFFLIQMTKGLQWFLLSEEDIAPSIIAMDGRRSRQTKSEHQPTGDGTGARPWMGQLRDVGEPNLQDVSDAKLLRKLEAQGQFTS